MKIPPFETIAFVDGARFEGLWERIWTTCVREVGPVQFPSGRIIVEDALCTGFGGHPGFERRAPTGLARVFVTTAESKTDVGEDDGMTLAAWVQFSDAPVAHWEPAYYGGYDPDDHYDPGFGVDSGTACIADAEAAAAIDTEADGELLLDAINATIAQPLECCFHPSDTAHFFAVRSGLGDGFYSSFWGLTADGTPAYLVVDFDLMRQPIWDVARLELPIRRGALHHEVFSRAGARVWIPRFPFFGDRKLRIRDGIPRVRVLDGDSVVASPERTWEGSDLIYDLGPLSGTHLEIAFSRGSKPAVPLT